MKLFGFVRDPHTAPHMMNKEGGCGCHCRNCVKESTPNYYKCICPRCNEHCPTLGRLGYGHNIRQEFAEGHPAGLVRGRRWYRK